MLGNPLLKGCSATGSNLRKNSNTFFLGGSFGAAKMSLSVARRVCYGMRGEGVVVGLDEMGGLAICSAPLAGCAKVSCATG